MEFILSVIICIVLEYVFMCYFKRWKKSMIFFTFTFWAPVFLVILVMYLFHLLTAEPVELVSRRLAFDVIAGLIGSFIGMMIYIFTSKD